MGTILTLSDDRLLTRQEPTEPWTAPGAATGSDRAQPAQHHGRERLDLDRTCTISREPEPNKITNRDKSVETTKMILPADRKRQRNGIKDLLSQDGIVNCPGD